MTQITSNNVDEEEFPHGYLETNIFLNKVCNKIIPVALLAIGLLIAGGLLLHYHVNTMAAGCLIGGGGIVAIGDLVYGVHKFWTYWHRDHLV